MKESERLGANLRDWRIVLGLSQDLVAERAAISRSTLIRMEQGKGAKLENFLSVAKALGIQDRVLESTDPLSSDLGRARAFMLHRQRAPRRESE